MVSKPAEAIRGTLERKQEASKLQTQGKRLIQRKRGCKSDLKGKLLGAWANTHIHTSVGQPASMTSQDRGTRTLRKKVDLKETTDSGTQTHEIIQ